jgi:antirestriction protein ArdC
MTSYEVITNQIIEKLNEGIIPWVKPWKVAGWKVNGKTASCAYSTTT